MTDQMLLDPPADVVLPEIHLGAPTVVGPLTLFPIWTDAPVSKSPIPLEPPGGATLGELANGPQIDALVATNPTAKPFALIEGTLVDGGWQHRVLVQSVLVGSHSSIDLQVRCVESGRWDGPQDQRVHSRRAPLGVRGAGRGLRRDAPPHQSVDQGDVWSRVEAYEEAYGDSGTSSLVDVLETIVIPRRLRDQVPAPLLGQRGVLVGVGGHPALVELFEHPRSLQRQWDALIDGLLRSSLHVCPVPTSTRRARAFVARLTHRSTEPSAVAGDGFVTEVADDLVSVRSLNTAKGRLVHAAALNVRHDLVLAA